MKRLCRCFSAGISFRVIGMMILLIFAGMSPGFVLPVRAEVVDRIVAIVNDDIVSLSEMNQIMVPYVAQARSMGYSEDREREVLHTLREEVINQLIDQKLANQEIKKSNISVDEKEIDAFVERLKASNQMTDEHLRAALASQGMTFEDYREKTKEQILRTKLINRKIKSRIIVTQDEINAYFEAHPEGFRGSTKLRISYILVKPPMFADDSIKSAILEKLSLIRTDLQNGQPYQTVVDRYQQGIFDMEAEELGVFSKEELSTEVVQMMEGLPEGSCTDVLETERGYQILYLNEIIAVPPKTLEQATPEIQEKLYKEALDKRFGAWIAELRKRSYIKIVQ